uniref:Uncharacterized protein n=1 Tax=Chromera velia CCMP2878 TaxID=1169474 RepID=A0A0G4F1L3_9ALVE|eukprot:Cvel_14589.t1-p1 / transcript=Cvel_14589.t1 / gene=Cvel_14589 / organism=Chromera_velia_CCMP2878 / gene_product=hypothetical protein / transcript_product=hypothetical protein / location=Cvel_scaffold1043:23831-26399(-) / protein_length=355 / sequence_SO=supercontig / SO=protein_coding / is_pseudo=false
MCVSPLGLSQHQGGPPGPARERRGSTARVTDAPVIQGRRQSIIRRDDNPFMRARSKLGRSKSFHDIPDLLDELEEEFDKSPSNRGLPTREGQWQRRTSISGAAGGLRALQSQEEIDLDQAIDQLPEDETNVKKTEKPVFTVEMLQQMWQQNNKKGGKAAGGAKSKWISHNSTAGGAGGRNSMPAVHVAPGSTKPSVASAMRSAGAAIAAKPGGAGAAGGGASVRGSVFSSPGVSAPSSPSPSRPGGGTTGSAAAGRTGSVPSARNSTGSAGPAATASAPVSPQNANAHLQQAAQSSVGYGPGSWRSSAGVAFPKKKEEQGPAAAMDSAFSANVDAYGNEMGSGKGGARRVGRGSQ